MDPDQPTNIIEQNIVIVNDFSDSSYEDDSNDGRDIKELYEQETYSNIDVNNYGSNLQLNTDLVSSAADNQHEK